MPSATRMNATLVWLVCPTDMKYFPLLLVLANPVWADLQEASEPLPVTPERYDSGNIYGISEATGLPELLKYTGNATGELTNINGSIKTITGGWGNITGVVDAANQANNQFANVVNRGMNIEGATRSIGNHVSNMFRLPGTPPNQ